MFLGFSRLLLTVLSAVAESLYPPNSSVEGLIPNVMVFRSGAFGNYLGLDEAMKVEPPERDWEEEETRALFLWPREDTAIRQLSTGQGGVLAGTQPD